MGVPQNHMGFNPKMDDVGYLHDLNYSESNPSENTRSLDTVPSNHLSVQLKTASDGQPSKHAPDGRALWRVILGVHLGFNGL